MTDIPCDFDTIFTKVHANIDKLTNICRINNDNNNNYDEDERERHSIEQQWQQIRLLLALETLVTQLKINITDTLVKESKNNVAHTAEYIMDIIQNNWETPDAVNHATQKLHKFFHSIMETIIQPSDYDGTIPEYISWQNKTMKYFLEKFWPDYMENHFDKEELNKVEKAWNWNERTNEAMFFGGAARPLFSEKITSFSDLLSSYYNKLDPLYVKNRNNLFDVLYRLVCAEGRKYWTNYDLFPSTTSKGIVEQCLLYFYSRDRDNTFFINSSASDYIPFVHLAQQIFHHEKFIGSSMTHPDDYNTKWLLEQLIEECTNICNQINKSDPLIIILLTSKNRFGARIDVDQIHQKLVAIFPGKIVTLVDACQDAQSYQYVDVILYSKRFTTTGAIALVNKRLAREHDRLSKNMALGTNFPVCILAQLYANIDMINTGLAFGIEDLVNSANWYDYSSPVLKELRSAFDSYDQQENSLSSIKITRKDNIQFEFTEDELGTIVTIRILNRKNEDESLSRLMAKLKEQGHTLDSFLMNDPFMESRNMINVKEVEELIENKDLTRLRVIESTCSAHLAWPLVPFSVIKSSDNLISKEHFIRCQLYHRCLRISVDRSGYPGKLKRFVDIVQQILYSNDLTDAIIGTTNFKNYSSQWPSRE